MRSNSRKTVRLIGTIAFIALGAIGVAQAEDHLASLMSSAVLLGATGLVFGLGALCTEALWIWDRTDS